MQSHFKQEEHRALVQYKMIEWLTEAEEAQKVCGFFVVVGFGGLWCIVYAIVVGFGV